MQTCIKCNAQSPDTARNCYNCGANLQEFSATMTALRRFQDNPRVLNIRLVVAQDACPACLEVERTYTKDQVPPLPVEGCSQRLGCRCYYEPSLYDIYP